MIIKTWILAFADRAELAGSQLRDAPAIKPGNQGAAQNVAFVRFGLIQPIFLFELSGKVALGQMLKILVGERV